MNVRNVTASHMNWRVSHMAEGVTPSCTSLHIEFHPSSDVRICNCCLCKVM